MTELSYEFLCGRGPNAIYKFEPTPNLYHVRGDEVKGLAVFDNFDDAFRFLNSLSTDL